MKFELDLTDPISPEERGEYENTPLEWADAFADGLEQKFNVLNAEVEEAFLNDAGDKIVIDIKVTVNEDRVGGEIIRMIRFLAPGAAVPG